MEIEKIVKDETLKGSLYSTFKCSGCGKKLIAQVVGNKLQFVCKDYKYGCGEPGQKEHDSFNLTLEEIAAIMTHNPLI